MNNLRSFHRFLKVAEKEFRLLPSVWRNLSFAALCLHFCNFPFLIFRRYRQSGANAAIVERDDFDSKYGTETSVRVHPTQLKISSSNWIHASPYFVTPSALLSEALQGLELEFEDLTFVDLGSGKGRVLLMAAQFPFRRIIGVEFSPELNQIADRNIRLYRGPKRCSRIQIVAADFEDYKFPAEPLFVFLYNPADLPVSKLLAENLSASIALFDREVWVLYVTPYPVFDEQPRFEKLREGECGGHPWSLYRAKVKVRNEVTA